VDLADGDVARPTAHRATHRGVLMARTTLITGVCQDMFG
jgi:hypothetical protein